MVKTNKKVDESTGSTGPVEENKTTGPTGSTGPIEENKTTGPTGSIEPEKTTEPDLSVIKVKEPNQDEPIKSVKVTLKNTSGEKVDPKDYFFKGIVLPSFEQTCGAPVEREDLLEVFHKVFRPEDNILFYKQADKEVYIIIVPLKYSTEIGEEQNSITGDFHKHAISFLNEGSVNLDSLKKKLEKIKPFVSYSDR